MDPSTVTFVRRVATRIGSSDPAILPLVEAELNRQQEAVKPDRFGVDWISLANLIVAVVSTAYPIVKDVLRERRDTMRRRLEEALDAKGLWATKERSIVIEATLDEIKDHLE
jgi:hypothetical protein